MKFSRQSTGGGLLELLSPLLIRLLISWISFREKSVTTVHNQLNFIFEMRMEGEQLKNKHVQW